MRRWVASGALIAAATLSAAVLALQGGQATPQDLEMSRSLSQKSGLSAHRDQLTPSEASAAHSALLLPEGVKSLLRSEGQLRHGEYRWDDKGVPDGKLVIWVDLKRQMISVIRGGHEIGTSVIVYGADGMPSPLGRFPIISKHRDYHSRAYDAPMPYSMFITNTGVALHGSPMSNRHATHGCIGLPIDFARLLFAVAKAGDQVEVVSSDPSALRRLSAGGES